MIKNALQMQRWENANDVIPDQYVTCQDDSVHVGYEFFAQKKAGEYKYIMEFGDVAYLVTFTVK